jgi:hypothetical protein
MKITKCEWEPSGKWDCGVLEFTVETDRGTLEVVDTVGGPQHGPDTGDLTVKLNGKEIYHPDGPCIDTGQPSVWDEDDRAAKTFRKNLKDIILKEVESLFQMIDNGEIEEEK